MSAEKKRGKIKVRLERRCCVCKPHTPSVSCSSMCEALIGTQTNSSTKRFIYISCVFIPVDLLKLYEVRSSLTSRMTIMMTLTAIPCRLNQRILNFSSAEEFGQEFTVFFLATSYYWKVQKCL